MRNTYAIILRRTIMNGEIAICSQYRIEVDAPTKEIALVAARNSLPNWKPVAMHLMKSVKI